MEDKMMMDIMGFDIDDIYMRGKKYFKVGMSIESYYNYSIANALELIGKYYVGNDKSKNSDYSKGVSYICSELGVSKAEIKSLRKNFRYGTRYIYRIPYNIAEITECMIRLLKKIKGKKEVKKFFESQESDVYRQILIAKHYSVIMEFSNRNVKVQKVYNQLNALTDNV